MPPGLDPKSGSVSPKQPIASPAAIRGSHSSFCSSLPKWWIANIASDPCTETRLRMPGVGGLELQAREAVGGRAGAGAAVALEVHAEQTERAELLGELARGDRGRLEPVGDVRPDVVVAEAPDRVADRPLLVVEKSVDARTGRAGIPAVTRRLHWILLAIGDSEPR